jgi:hypothetical protein
MIAESTPRYVGSAGGDRAWETWYKPYFNLLLKHAHIKAFCYINASWQGHFEPTFAFDCRIQSNAFVTTHYRKALFRLSLAEKWGVKFAVEEP